MLRTDDTDEEVDLRPRRPAELCRWNDERGVSGDGERDLRCDPTRAPSTRGPDVLIAITGPEFDATGVKAEP